MNALSSPTAAVPANNSAGSASAPATATFSITGSPASLSLPAINGIASTIALPAVTNAAGTTLSVTASTTDPSDSSMSNAVRQTRGETLAFLVFYTLTVNQTMTFPSLPGFVVTLPQSVSTAGLQFFYAVSNPTATNSALQFLTEGPAAVSGQQLTFATSSDSLTLQPGLRYIFAFFATTGTATPGPSPTSMLPDTTVATTIPCASGSYLLAYQNGTLTAQPVSSGADFDISCTASTSAVSITVHGHHATTAGVGFSNQLGYTIDQVGPSTLPSGGPIPIESALAFGNHLTNCPADGTYCTGVAAVFNHNVGLGGTIPIFYSYGTLVSIFAPGFESKLRSTP